MDWSRPRPHGSNSREWDHASDPGKLNVRYRSGRLRWGVYRRRVQLVGDILGRTRCREGYLATFALLTAPPSCVLPHALPFSLPLPLPLPFTLSLPIASTAMVPAVTAASTGATVRVVAGLARSAEAEEAAEAHWRRRCGARRC